jgi:hypothetical protein
MSRQTFEQLRLPAGILLALLAVFILWPRDGAEPLASASPTASVVIGEVGGVVVTPGPTPSPTVAPSVAPVASVALEPTPTVAPTPAGVTDGFSAEVLACRSISGSNCNDQLGTLPASAGAFTALVRFTAANAGDTLNATLSGPSGPIAGFPYTLQGNGDGYYYTQFQVGSLPGGEYALTATRNGAEVASTSFRIAGN